MTVRLRDATRADRQRCLELLSELQSDMGSEETRSREAVFDSLLSRERGQILLAQEGSAILGMAAVSYNLALRYGGEYCQLEELIVSAQARGKNVGGLLVQAIVANARARGCAEIGLYLVAATEHNRPFYEKYGFAVVGSEMRQSLTD